MRLSRHFTYSICSVLSSKTHILVGDQTHTGQFCLRNFFYTINYTIKFTGFSTLFLLIIPSDDLLCDMKHITVSFSDTRKILQARFSVCGRELQLYNSFTPQCAPAWKALLSLHLYVCYRNITK